MEPDVIYIPVGLCGIYSAAEVPCLPK